MRSRSSLQGLLIGFLIVLFMAFLGAMFLDSVESYLSGLLGVASGGKFKLLQTLGFAMGGVLVALQALASNRRATAMETAAIAQAAAMEEQTKANLNVEERHRQERLKNAIEHLGHSSPSVRLGGAYELVNLAFEKEALRATVMEILCAHIRQTTTQAEYTQEHLSSPSTEVQSLLSVLFVENHTIFDGCKAKLQGSCLNRVNLANAHLVNVNFEGAQLQQANLHQACLQGSLLLNTNLTGAMAARADLSGAKILTSSLRGAVLFQTIFRGSTIIGTQMQLADLRHAELQGSQTQGLALQGAQLDGAQFHGMRAMAEQSSDGSTSLKFSDIVNAGVGKNTDFSEVVFEGGLTEEDVKSVVGCTADDAARSNRKKLIVHVGKAKSHELPPNSLVRVGLYTAEEAEKWIFGYLA